MLSLVEYLGCHPGILRNIRLRHKRLGLVVVLIVCAVFFIKEYQLLAEHGNSQGLESGKGAMRQQMDYFERREKGEDEVLMLRAHIGYLKTKLASLGKSAYTIDPMQPVIYVITPTHTRPEQKAELVRISQTFLLVPNLYWIVVEDAEEKTKLVENLLAKSGLSYTHLNIETPKELKITEEDPHWLKPRGVIQRNEALHWLRDKFREETHNKPNGVIYFADDDNTYHVQVFEEMRDTQTVSVWPVGLVGGLMVEKPKIGESTGGTESGKKVVIGWDVSWSPHRPFAVDMAGFAVNLKLFLSRPKAKFAYRVKRGHQESEFLRHLVSDLKELEPKADNCQKVWVWHTRTEKVNLVQEQKRKTVNLIPSNLNIEV